MKMKWLRLVHRYVGLTIAIFIVLVSVTGSLLAFYPELERATSPGRFPVIDPGKETLALPVLAHYAQQSDSRVVITSLRIDEMGRALVAVTGGIDPRTGVAFELEFGEMVLNARTGELLGTRNRGVISEGWHNLMSFIYLLHYSLLLDVPGEWLLGIVALIWTIDCFTGLVITFPRRRAASGKPWLLRWKKAWQVKTDGSVWRLNFDVHRAFSLWLWVALGVFAWSSVYMNLTETVYTPITRALMPFQPPWYALPGRADTPIVPPHSFEAMYAHAEREMRRCAKQDGFVVRRIVRLSYNPEYGAYRFGVLSNLDISDRLARTDIYLDANTHALLLRYYPTSQLAGNTVSNWIYALHTARVWGLPYRIFVCALGIALATITITGVLIWWRKRESNAAGHRLQGRVAHQTVRPPLPTGRSDVPEVSGVK